MPSNDDPRVSLSSLLCSALHMCDVFDDGDVDTLHAFCAELGACLLVRACLSVCVRVCGCLPCMRDVCLHVTCVLPACGAAAVVINAKSVQLMLYLEAEVSTPTSSPSAVAPLQVSSSQVRRSGIRRYPTRSVRDGYRCGVLCCRRPWRRSCRRTTPRSCRRRIHGDSDANSASWRRTARRVSRPLVCIDTATATPTVATATTATVTGTDTATATRTAVCHCCIGGRRQCTATVRT
jgi:hypothetical protein